jgi:hypothetical protein
VREHLPLCTTASRISCSAARAMQLARDSHRLTTPRRDTPAGAGSMQMHFHHDAALPSRVSRKPYHPCDWLCSICYLT